MIGSWQSLFIESFSEGNEMVFALSVVSNIVGETPMLYFANNVMATCGYVNCLYTVFLAFVLR